MFFDKGWKLSHWDEAFDKLLLFGTTYVKSEFSIDQFGYEGAGTEHFEV